MRLSGVTDTGDAPASRERETATRTVFGFMPLINLME